jgi:predicted DNA-binding mobile mystery protein A
MDWNLRQLACKQLSKRLKAFQQLTVPNDGWIKTIRTVLGMTMTQLAKRSSFSKQRIMRIENDERLKKITLATLEKIAQQLGCKLLYAIVPDDTLLSLIKKQADKVAREKLSNISHSMALEDQRVKGSNQEYQVELLKEELLKNNIKDIWQ